MSKPQPILAVVLVAAFNLQCSTLNVEPTPAVARSTNDVLVDSLATPETVALYKNLRTLASDGFLFGHQETTAYGIGWTHDGAGIRSDVKDVCGDFPAIFGWDIGDIDQPTNVDGVPFPRIKSLIRDAFYRGGVNTISMHLDNPVTGGDGWDNTPAVPHILPGGSHHERYLQTLDLVAAFLKDLKTRDGSLIPVVFRPYHEHNQRWPWWGVKATSESDFIALWRMTIDYLRDDHGLHHLLYAISPQDTKTAEAYFERYPGDDYVDVLGMDNWRFAADDFLPFLSEALDMLGREATDRGKLPALTEVGHDRVPIPDWWTEYLLKAVDHGDYSRMIAWALVWRNASTGHFHAPYPGQTSAADFIEFYNHPETLFQSDLPDMYVSQPGN